MKYFENEDFGLEDFESELTLEMDDLKLDFEPEDDDLNIGDDTDQSTLLD